MTKTEALRLMNCTQTELARKIGTSPQAVYMWPEELSDLQRDRVQAALWRRQHGQELAPPSKATPRSTAAAA